MKKIFVILICLVITFSFVACSQDSDEVRTVPAEFTEAENKSVVAEDGTKYTFVGYEGSFWSFGEWDFIGHIKGEKESFIHLSAKIKTGMYSVNGEKDVLVRYFPDQEFVAFYVKSDLLKTEATLENCVRFLLVNDSLESYDKKSFSGIEIHDGQQFLAELKNGQTAEKAKLYDLIKQPDGSLKNCYSYGFVIGVLQDDLNLVIPFEITSFDDQAYSIEIDGVEYVFPTEWAIKVFEN